MQAPRNWRMKVERYRLVGTENTEGNTSVVNRPPSLAERTAKEDNNQPQLIKATAA